MCLGFYLRFFELGGLVLCKMIAIVYLLVDLGLMWL